jgi:hypothetical protein
VVHQDGLIPERREIEPAQGSKPSLGVHAFGVEQAMPVRVRPQLEDVSLIGELDAGSLMPASGLANHGEAALLPVAAEANEHRAVRHVDGTLGVLDRRHFSK